MKTIIISFLIAMIAFSGCSSTLKGAKNDADKNWEVTKDTSKKAWKATKEGANDAYDATKKAIHNATSSDEASK